jgi:hypothetical protein
MLLRDVIQQLDTLPEEATVFADRVGGHFTPESEAVCLELTEEESRTPIGEVAARRAPGKAYFLEVFVAREVLEGWVAMRGVKDLDPEEAARVVVHYAEHDAWPSHEAG